MPKGKVPRYKTIRCRTCGEVIRRFDRSRYRGWKVPASDILAAIRRHYKRHHPRKFRQQVKKAVQKRRKRR